MSEINLPTCFQNYQIIKVELCNAVGALKDLLKAVLMSATTCVFVEQFRNVLPYLMVSQEDFSVVFEVVT